MFSSCIDWFNGDYFLSFFLFLVDWASFSFVRSSVLSFFHSILFFILPDFCCHRRRRRCCLSKGSPQQKQGRENESFTRPFCLAAFCFVLFRFSSKNETKTRQKIFFYLFQCTEIDTSKWLRLRREGITKVREEEAPKELYKKKKKKTQSAVLQKKNE